MTWARRFATPAGVVVVVGALLPPLHSLADQLFSAHMVQHLLIMVVGAGLLAWGSTKTSSAGVRSALYIAALNIVVLWGWHLPRLYDAALASVPLHALEHASFFVAGWLFWRLVLGRSGVEHPARLGVTLVTMLQSGALGALITLADRVLYRSHQGSPTMTALEDQQLAGVIMWVPAGTLYLVVLLVLLAQMLRPYPDPAGTAETQ
ncbi:MAG TPA: cytochrome c oxidase assembly protein [Actinomycetota bacterium]|nr:cytochrome c oxidase assembly protein [Actinomycetota bacterium]